MSKKTEIEAFFATGKTPNQISPANVVVDEKQSGLTVVDGEVNVPAGVTGLPEGNYFVTWNPNGRVMTYSPRTQNPEAMVLLSIFKPVA